MLRSFFIALSFLTIIPSLQINNWQADDFAKSLRAYPIVGLLIGAILLMASYILAHSNSLLSSILIVALWYLLTGGLHFDGFCDTADAAFASKNPIERQKIAKDPRIGSFAFLTGSLLIVLKFAAVQAISSFELIIFAPLIARTIIILIMPLFPIQASSQIAKIAVISKPEAIKIAFFGFALTLVLALLLSKLKLILFALVISSLLSILAARWINSRMLGLNGDSYGAIIELAELSLLLLFALLF